MILSADVKAFLVGAGVAPDDWSFDGYLPPTPDRLVLITIAGGSGTQFERLYDTPSVQIFTRGLQNNAADAEVLAAQVDDAFMDAAEPVTIGARVISIDRVGGPPRFYQRDAGRRTLFVCSYVFTLARS